QQLLAANSNEAVPTAADAFATIVDFDVIPVVEGLGNLLGRNWVCFTQVVQCFVGKHDAPTEGVVRAVALDDGNFVLRVAKLHQQAKVKACRTSANTNNLHECSPLQGSRPLPRAADLV